MKKLAIMLAFLSFQSSAEFTLDLTEPDNFNIAKVYSPYKLLRSLNFYDTDGRAAFVGLKKNKNNENWDAIYEASIDSNSAGQQRIYIHSATSCFDEKTNYKNVIIRTNDKKVRYSKFCDGSNIYYTPLTQKGAAFLIHQFTDSDSVIFEFPKARIAFDAEGFENAWNNYKAMPDLVTGIQP